MVHGYQNHGESILVKEANGRIFLDERSIWPDGKFVTANIAASTDYLKNNPDVIEKLLAAYVNETIWMNNHKDDAIKAFNTELKKLTGKTIAEDELRQAWSRMDFTYDPLKISLFQSANSAYDLGFLAKGKPRPDLSGIFDLTILDQVLKQKGLQPVEGGSTTTTSGAANNNLSLTVKQQISSNSYFFFIFIFSFYFLKLQGVLSGF